MEDKHVYGFSKVDASRVLQSVGIAGVGERVVGQGVEQNSYIVKAPSGGIAGRSGSTVTIEDCDVYHLEGTTLTSSGFSVPVTNLSTTAVTGDAYGVTLYAGGSLICVWEDC